MGEFSPNFFSIKKPRNPGAPNDAFDPGIDVGSGDIPASASAFSPALQPHSDAARSTTGGATGGAITPSHDPITSPRSQYEADLMDTEQKIAAFQPKKMGFWKGLASAYLPVLGPHFTGDYENEYNVKKAGTLTGIVNAQRQMEQSQAYSDYLLGRNSTAQAVADTRANASRDVATTKAGASTDVANIRGDSAMDVAGLKADSAESIASQKIANPKLNDFEQFYKDYLDANKITDSSRSRLAARREYAAAGQPPQRSPQQLAIGPDGKVIELKPGVQVPQGTKSVSGDLGNAKTTADEQRRADLAANLNENLDQLEEIAKRRPDLFGPMAGRMTSAKQFVGTSDPDVAALKVIQEQTGMAMVGAHAMRNAQHVETAANSIMNAYRNDPKAIIGPGGSIEKARASLKTFLEKQPVVGGTAAGGGGTSGAQSAPPPGAKIRDYTQLGH